MNAVIVRERVMSEDSRILKLETDAVHLQSDVSETKSTLKWLCEAFTSFKIEVTKEFGEVKTSIESLRTSIESTKLWRVVTGLGTILSMLVAALALARLLKP